MSKLSDYKFLTEAVMDMSPHISESYDHEWESSRKTFHIIHPKDRRWELDFGKVIPKSVKVIDFTPYQLAPTIKLKIYYRRGTKLFAKQLPEKDGSYIWSTL